MDSAQLGISSNALIIGLVVILIVVGIILLILALVKTNNSNNNGGNGGSTGGTGGTGGTGSSGNNNSSCHSSSGSTSSSNSSSKLSSSSDSGSRFSGLSNSKNMKEEDEDDIFNGSSPVRHNKSSHGDSSKLSGFPDDNMFLTSEPSSPSRSSDSNSASKASNVIGSSSGSPMRSPKRHRVTSPNIKPRAAAVEQVSEIPAADSALGINGSADEDPMEAQEKQLSQEANMQAPKPEQEARSITNPASLSSDFSSDGKPRHNNKRDGVKL